MRNRKTTLMGVDIDNLTLEETVEKILQYVEQYSIDQQNRYVSTVNVDFLVNTHSMNWNRVRDPELLNILRSSSVATADGMPILWLSTLMGCPLEERVTGSDLFLRLLTELGQRRKAVYFVGGSSKTAKIVSLLLEALYPGLTVAGIITPKICIEGEDLLYAPEQDMHFVDQINSTSPDLLFICLGNPKQEIWYNRIKEHLKVPLSIGIGGSLDMAFGPIGRAPEWMQKYGLEWVYRLYQEPKRLWKRYLIGGSKFLGMSVPLLLGHGLARSYMHLKSDHSLDLSFPEPPRLFSSHTLTIAVLKLPTILNEDNYKIVMGYTRDAGGQDATVIDFSQLGFLSINQLSHLVDIWKSSVKKSKQLFAFGIGRSQRLFLKIHRLWDLIAPYTVEDSNQILATLPIRNSDEAFFYSFAQIRDKLIISFLGPMHENIDYESLMHQLAPYFLKQSCLLDLTYCTNIENAGMCFLLAMRNELQADRKSLKIANPFPAIRRLFRLTKTKEFFEFV